VVVVCYTIVVHDFAYCTNRGGKRQHAIVNGLIVRLSKLITISHCCCMIYHKLALMQVECCCSCFVVCCCCCCVVIVIVALFVGVI